MKWPDGWLPDLMVISLDRLPSHGRAVAEWVWEAKKRQHIPILFCGGEPDKVAATKAKFPKAIYCATDAVAATIAKLPKATAPSEATRGLTKRRKSEKK